MKALSLWQPWAWLIFQQYTFYFPQQFVKRIETRSRRNKFKGRIAIHAAKFRKLDQEIYFEIGNALKESGANVAAIQLNYLKHGIPKEQYGAVIGTVEVVDIVPIEQLYGTEYDTPLERSLGDWSPGRFGWILQDPILFEKPIPARGNQGFWNWMEDEEDENQTDSSTLQEE